MLTCNEGLIRDVKFKGSLGFSGHNVVEFKIVRAGRKVKSKFTALGVWRAESSLFRRKEEAYRGWKQG